MAPLDPPVEVPQGQLSAQERVAKHLREELLDGRYPPGSRLPPERRLAQDLEVSRSTLRGALAVLSSEGLVRPRRGSGFEVLDHQLTGGLELMSWLLSHRKAAPEDLAHLFEELVRLRRPLAVDTMVRAAALVSEEDVLGLEALAKAQRERLDDPLAYFAGDEEYQRTILRVLDSTALELLFNCLARLIRERVELTLAFMGSLEDHWETYALVHELLRAGLKGADPHSLRIMAETALDEVEERGLCRVRALCQGELAAEVLGADAGADEGERS